MKTWTIAKLATPCGFCARAITVGGPMLVLEGLGNTGGVWKKFRCRLCAAQTGEVPPDRIDEESADTRRARAKETAAAAALKFTGVAQQALELDES
jgi:hypothetical protein